MMRAALALPERHPGRTIAALGCLLAAAYLTGAVLLARPDRRLVVGDAVHYYVYLRSAVFDRDLHFRNEYVTLYGLAGSEPGTGWVYEPTATGHVRNVMPIGPAIVWTPLFLLTTAVVGFARLAGAPVALDGYGRAFQASAALSGIAAASAGAWLTCRLVSSIFDRRTAIWSTLAVWTGSSALYYSLVSPAYSHAASMFAAGLFFHVWGTTIGDERWTRFVRIGLAAGLAALIRWQDVVFLAAPAVEVAWTTMSADRPRAIARGIGQLAVCGAAAAVAFIPQNLAWLTLYGTPFTVPQGGEFMKWTAPALVRVLFSDWHGLFSWTPIAAIGVIGLAIPIVDPREPASRRVLMFGALTIFMASWYVNAAVADWWAGEAFGARRFVSCFPIFTLGVAAIARRVPRPAIGVAAACALSVSNLLLLFQYQLFMHGQRAPYPGGVYGMTVERFVVPVRMIVRWWRG